MALSEPYLDVPGTTIFDAEQSRKGDWPNQFCMSLMNAEGRERFESVLDQLQATISSRNTQRSMT